MNGHEFRVVHVGKFALAVLLSLFMSLQGVPAAAIAEEAESAEQAIERESTEQIIAEGQTAAEGMDPEDATPEPEPAEVATQSQARYSGTCGTCAWEIDAEGALTVRPQDGVEGDLGYSYTNRYYQPWEDYKTEITSAYFEPGVKAGPSIAGLFMGCTSLKYADISNLDTSATTSMERTFEHCETMTTLVLGDPDTSNVKNMDAVFMDCWALESLDVGVLETSSATDMSGMLARCKQIRSFDLTGFDTSNVTSMYAMFNGCDALETVDLSGFDTSNVTDMCAMFSDCPSLTALDFSGFVTSKVTRFSNLAGNCESLREVDISGMEISDGADAGADGMFPRCPSLERVITDGTADLARVFPYGYDGITIVNTSIEAKDLSSAEVTLSQTSYMYYGTDHCPKVTVTLDGQTLSAGTDYDVAYADNVNAGTATVTVTGKDNYTGTARATFTIQAVSLNFAEVSLAQTTFAYDGTEKRPEVIVTLNREPLVAGTDYDVAYANNVEVGTATVTVTGKGNYTDAESVTFTIGLKDVSSAEVNLSQTSYTYDGAEKCPEVTVTLGGQTLVAGTDYDVVYADNVNAGTATVTVTGKGDYVGTKTANFSIAKAASKIALAGQTKTYNGKVLAYSGKVVKSGSSGAVTYKYFSDANCTKTATPKAAGTYYVRATLAADANHNGATSAAAKFVIAKAASKISLAAQTKGYTGKVLAYSGKVTKSGSTGKVTYKYYSDAKCTKTATPKAAGTYYVRATLAADANCKGATSAAAKFTVVKGTSVVKAAAQTKTYNGKALVYTGKVTKTGSTGKVSKAYFTDAKCTKAVKAANVKAARTYYVRVSVAADANFKGASVVAKFTIAKAASKISLAGQTKTYNGKVLAYSGKVTRSGSAGKVTYKYFSDAKCTKTATPKAAGTYYVRATLAADANHKGATSAAAKFVIAKAASKISLAAQAKTYTGKVLAYSGKVVKSGSAGKVTYKYFSDAKCTKTATPKAARTYYVRATLAADANHKGATSAAVKFTVAKASAFKVSLPKTTYEYTGKAISPAPVVKLGSVTLVKGTDYTVSYKNNVNAGTATVVVTGKGGLTGTKSVSFKIVSSPFVPCPQRSGATRLAVEGLVTTGDKTKILNRINAIRDEANRENINGVSNREHIAWSDGLAYVSEVRAIETYISFAHQRPCSGQYIYMDNDTGVDLGWSWGENIAYNYSSVEYAIEQFYSEKDALVNHTGGETGHYESMISPGFTHFGMGGFVKDMDGYSKYCVAQEFGRADAALPSGGKVVNKQATAVVNVANDSVNSALQIPGVRRY